MSVDKTTSLTPSLSRIMRNTHYRFVRNVVENAIGSQNQNTKAEVRKLSQAYAVRSRISTSVFEPPVLMFPEIIPIDVLTYDKRFISREIFRFDSRETVTSVREITQNYKQLVSRIYWSGKYGRIARK